MSKPDSTNRIPIYEGTVRKGGVNRPSPGERPGPPAGQGGSESSGSGGGSELSGSGGGSGSSG